MNSPNDLSSGLMYIFPYSHAKLSSVIKIFYCELCQIYEEEIIVILSKLLGNRGWKNISQIILWGCSTQIPKQDKDISKQENDRWMFPMNVGGKSLTKILANKIQQDSII